MWSLLGWVAGLGAWCRRQRTPGIGLDWLVLILLGLGWLTGLGDWLEAQANGGPPQSLEIRQLGEREREFVALQGQFHPTLAWEDQRNRYRVLSSPQSQAALWIRLPKNQAVEVSQAQRVEGMVTLIGPDLDRALPAAPQALGVHRDLLLDASRRPAGLVAALGLLLACSGLAGLWLLSLSRGHLVFRRASLGPPASLDLGGAVRLPLGPPAALDSTELAVAISGLGEINEPGLYQDGSLKFKERPDGSLELKGLSHLESGWLYLGRERWPAWRFRVPGSKKRVILTCQDHSSYPALGRVLTTLLSETP